MKTYTLTELDLQRQLNRTKGTIDGFYLSEGIIDQATYDKMQSYVVVVAEKGWFGKLFDKIFDTEDDKLMYTLLKIPEKKTV